MSTNIYTAGLRNVGSYQVAGVPYLTASNISSFEKMFTFPYVTKNIIVQNTGSSDLYLYFTFGSLNKLILPANKSLNMDIKCTYILASSSAPTGMQMAASLTTIDYQRMYSLYGLEGT